MDWGSNNPHHVTRLKATCGGDPRGSIELQIILTHEHLIVLLGVKNFFTIFNSKGDANEH
jgi:hypothetical protein